jgi:hypothetical protein
MQLKGVNHTAAAKPMRSVSQRFQGGVRSILEESAIDVGGKFTLNNLVCRVLNFILNWSEVASHCKRNGLSML